VSDVDSCVLGNVGGRELRGGVLEVTQGVIKCAPILPLLPDIWGKARHDARHCFDFPCDVTLSLRGGGGAGGERGGGGRRRRGMVKASRSRSEGDVKATSSASEGHILPNFASSVATAPCRQETLSLLGISGEAQVVDAAVAAGFAGVAGAIAGFTSGSSPLNQPKESAGGGQAKEKEKESVKALATLSDLRERERERESARALTLAPPLRTAAPAPEGLAGGGGRGGGRGGGGAGGEEEMKKDGTEAKKEPFRMRPRKCKSPPPQSVIPPPSDSLSLSHPAPDHGTETHARQKGKTEEALSVTPPPQEAPEARELPEEVLY
jgi:hypothetical protein